MLTSYFKTITAMLMIASYCQAQVPITFKKNYGGIYRDFGSNVIQLEDSGYVVGGIIPAVATQEDVFLYRTNKYGDTLWSKRYGGVKGDGIASLIRTNDGGFFIAGTTASFGIGSPTTSNWWVIKTNIMGDTLWTKTYGGTGNDGLSYGIQTSDKGYLLIGSLGNGFAQAYAIKTDSLGNQLFASYFGVGTSNSTFRHCIEKYPGKYVFVGKTFQSNYNTYVVLTDSALNVLNYKVYNMNNYSAGVDVGMQIESFYNGYLIGTSTGQLLRINDQLDTLRSMSINPPPSWDSFGQEDKYYDFKKTSDHNLIFTSWGGNQQVAIMKTDTNLNMIWQKFHGTTDVDFGRNIIQTSDGGYAVGGVYKYSYNTAFTDDLYLVKTDSLGNIGVFTSIENQVTDKIYFYPNPVDNQLIFKTNNAVESIQIMNNVGQILDSVHSKNLSEITFNTSDFPQGIYFIEMILIDNSKITKKFIKE